MVRDKLFIHDNQHQNAGSEQYLNTEVPSLNKTVNDKLIEVFQCHLERLNKRVCENRYM